jgi:hypothetical protein
MRVMMHDRSHVSVLANRLWDLNVKFGDIRLEPQYQREAASAWRIFMTFSETTNFVRYGTASPK